MNTYRLCFAAFPCITQGPSVQKAQAVVVLTGLGKMTSYKMWHTESWLFSTITLLPR